MAWVGEQANKGKSIVQGQNTSTVGETKQTYSNTRYYRDITVAITQFIHTILTDLGLHKDMANKRRNDRVTEKGTKDLNMGGRNQTE